MQLLGLFLMFLGIFGILGFCLIIRSGGQTNLLASVFGIILIILGIVGIGLLFL